MPFYIDQIQWTSVFYAVAVIFVCSVATETYVRESHPESTMRPSMLLGSFAEFLNNFFTRVGTYLYNVFDPFFYWNYLREYIIEIWNKFIDILRWIRDNVWKKIKDCMTWVWDRFIDFLDWAWPFVKEWVIWIKEWVMRVWNRFVDFLDWAWLFVKEWVIWIKNKFIDVFNWIKNKIIQPIIRSMGDLFDPFIRCVTSGFYVIKGYFQGIKISRCGPLGLIIMLIVFWQYKFFWGLFYDIFCLCCAHLNNYAWFKTKFDFTPYIDHEYVTFIQIFNMRPWQENFWKDVQMQDYPFIRWIIAIILIGGCIMLT